MTDARKLFKSGRRYRGLAPFGNGYVPVSFNVYPTGLKEVRLRHLFPLETARALKEGDILYALIEDEAKAVAELRVVSREDRGLIASLDFVTEDRRKLPRLKVEGMLSLEAELRCEAGSFKGSVKDISMSSVRLGLDGKVRCDECVLTILYKGLKTVVRGRVVRSDDESAVVEIENGSAEMVELLHRIYSDVFLKVQRLR